MTDVAVKLQGTLLLNPDFIGKGDDSANLSLTMEFLRVLNFMFFSYGHDIKTTLSWSQGCMVIQRGPDEHLHDIKHLVNLAFIDFENCNYLINPTCQVIKARNPNPQERLTTSEISAITNS